MRIYSNLMEAIREVERDLYEMGIEVHPQTMQDKVVADNPEYMTKELQAYGFQIARGYEINPMDASKVIGYILAGGGTGADPKIQAEVSKVMKYIDEEFMDRWVEDQPSNPGNSYEARKELWNEFLHKGKFAYTYSERIYPQKEAIIQELRERPGTRQAIINIHSNICPDLFYNGDEDINQVKQSNDLRNMGGSGRIPCSMYYQFLWRNERLDMIYTMRSCDFLTHFYVDVILAMRAQAWVAEQLGIRTGNFTYFTGSLHAYNKDMKTRGIF